jgi:hypothetical protein
MGGKFGFVWSTRIQPAVSENIFWDNEQIKTNSVALSPQANYTD